MPPSGPDQHAGGGTPEVAAAGAEALVLDHPEAAEGAAAPEAGAPQVAEDPEAALAANAAAARAVIAEHGGAAEPEAGGKFATQQAWKDESDVHEAAKLARNAAYMNATGARLTWRRLRAAMNHGDAPASYVPPAPK